jgi:hypothetical protein
MNLLANYGDSDSEGGSDHEKELKKSPVTTSAASALNRNEIPLKAPTSLPTKETLPDDKASLSNDKTAPKKKKIDLLRFLPAHIQTALSRGDTLSDSDSDEENTLTTSTKAAVGSTSKCSLIAMLPKPTAQDETVAPKLMKPLSLVKAKKSVEQSPKIPAQVEANAFIPGDEENYRTRNIEGINESIDMNSSDKNSSSIFSFHEKDNHVLRHESSLLFSSINSAPQLNNSFKIQTAPAIAAPLPISSAPSIAQQQQQQQDSALYAYAYNQDPSQYGAIDSSAAPQSYANTQYYDSYGYGYSNDQQLAGSLPANEYGRPYDGGEESRMVYSRKRDRNLEQELLSGNVEAISSNNNAKVLMSAPMEKWDPSKYEERHKKEMQAQSVFNLGQKGQDKMVVQPSRLQNRRHQINSLVANAAQVELELMEARGARNKTKSETQAKYGW